MADIEGHTPSKPHRISFFSLLLVTQGTGIHQIDLKDYTLEAGTVLKIAKGQIHAFQEDATYEGSLLVFTEEFILNYFSRSSIQLISHLYNYHLSSPIATDHEGNQTLIDQLNLELEDQGAYAHNNIIAAYLDLYLLKLERNTYPDEFEHSSSKNYQAFIQFKNLVESNYTETRNVKDYASKMFISTKHLNEVVKEFTINTAKNFIDDYVTLEAKRYIVSTSNSFKEVAYTIGFDEVTNFTKFFKKKTNCTPKEFRTRQTK